VFSLKKIEDENKTNQVWITEPDTAASTSDSGIFDAPGRVEGNYGAWRRFVQ
jgi:hypothetical protein